MQSQLEKLVALLAGIGRRGSFRVSGKRPEAAVLRELCRLLGAPAGAMACHLAGQRGVLAATTGLDRRAQAVFRKIIARENGDLSRFGDLFDHGLVSGPEADTGAGREIADLKEAAGYEHRAALPLTTPMGRGAMILFLASLTAGVIYPTIS